MNFAWIMFILLLVTGSIWLLDRWVLQRRRAPDGKEPWWVEYPKSFFPVILIVFVLRSFLVEPFKIPSGSMIPTLLVGDFILVNKYAFGLRLPILNIKVVDVGEPERGDVMVFRYPENPSLDYIKRVIGLPGDKIEYRNKRFTINGEPVPVQPIGEYSYVESGLDFVTARLRQEKLGDHLYSTLVQAAAPNLQLAGVRQFPRRENCAYNDAVLSCTVPAGHYFMVGDNRDSSFDSRYWGFVPEQNIVGKAFIIWWNFDALKRIGHPID
ncbi:MAG: signal peptidase I [Burkholderiales bacterium]|nr:signal peptidase I [Burkholderiales bacterium]